MITPRMPPNAERVLGALGADPHLVELVLGDLAEEFEFRARWDGEGAARRWYRYEAIRVMPFLMGDWGRRLGWRGAVRLASSTILASLAIMALEFVLHRTIVVPASLSPVVEQSLMLAWTSADAFFGGFVAASLSRRAPMPNAFVLATLWVLGTAAEMASYSPLPFRILTLVVIACAMLTGGAVHTALRAR